MIKKKKGSLGYEKLKQTEDWNLCCMLNNLIAYHSFCNDCS